jgi:hypothetical protein
MRIYLASKSRHAEFVAALNAGGFPLASSWHSWPFNRNAQEPERADWREHSERCLREAAGADVCVLYAPDATDMHFGSLLEAGAALGAGKRVYLVSPHDWPFLRNHPRVRSFPNLAAAVTELVAARTPPLGPSPRLRPK